jgi:uncharacterized protein YxeA
MKKYLTRLIVLVVVVIAGSWVWSHRDSLAILDNNSVRIQGDWHKVEMDFTNTDIYTFTETFISLDGEEWAAYKLLRGSRIEIETRGDVKVYELSFPDDENMVWSIRKDDKLVTAVRWRR